VRHCGDVATASTDERRVVAISHYRFFISGPRTRRGFGLQNRNEESVNATIACASSKNSEASFY
jgi:hypothetical protein